MHNFFDTLEEIHCRIIVVECLTQGLCGVFIANLKMCLDSYRKHTVFLLICFRTTLDDSKLKLF